MPARRIDACFKRPVCSAAAARSDAARAQMNLQAMVAPLVGAINPPMIGNVLISTGSTQNADFSRTPIYSTATGISMQVQPLSSKQIEHVDALNLSGVFRSVYLNGRIDSLVRVAGKGGDILQLPTGYSGQAFDTWLVVEQAEAFDTAGWVRVIVQLQNAIAA